MLKSKLQKAMAETKINMSQNDDNINNEATNARKAIDSYGNVDYWQQRQASQVVGDYIRIENYYIGQDLQFGGAYSYQMDVWNKAFKSVLNGQNFQSNTFAHQSSGQFYNGFDTNAEAYFSLFCNVRTIRFKIRVRSLKWLSINWLGDDAWNECFDLRVNAFKEWQGHYSTEMKSVQFGWVLVSGTFNMPYDFWRPTINIVRHEIGTRFITAFEHCDYTGFPLVLGTDGLLASPNIGSGLNDALSSVRVPLG